MKSTSSPKYFKSHYLQNLTLQCVYLNAFIHPNVIFFYLHRCQLASYQNILL